MSVILDWSRKRRFAICGIRWGSILVKIFIFVQRKWFVAVPKPSVDGFVRVFERTINKGRHMKVFFSQNTTMLIRQVGSNASLPAEHDSD